MRDQNGGDDYFICSNCGAELPIDARFCRYCGASDDAGWDEGDHDWDRESPPDWDDDLDFDYDEFLAREFPEHAPSNPRHRSWRWSLLTCVALLCIPLLLLSLVF